MTSNYSSHQMKKLIANIETSRSSISSKKNVHNNFSALKETFAELDSGIKGQSVFIKQLNIGQNHNNKKGNPLEKVSEQKRMLLKIIDLTYEEINSYFKISKDIFSFGIKDKKQTNGYQKALHDIINKLNGLRSSITPQNTFQIIFKILNIRDSLLKQFFRAMIYKKNLLWLDLKMPYQSYIHHQVQSILDIIKVSPQKYGYVPTKLQFSPVGFDHGQWSTIEQKTQSTLPQLVQLAFIDLQQMNSSLKNYGSLNDTPGSFQDINKNKVIIKGFRQKIQQLNINYNTLFQKYKSIQFKQGDNEIKLKFDTLTSQSLKKDIQISILQSNILTYQNTNQNLKDKIKQLQQELLRLNVNYYPKLKDVDLIQKNLLQEFFKIRKQIDIVNTSLQNDTHLKKKLQNNIKDQKQLVENLVNILGRQRRKIKDLKQQIKKLDELVLELTNKKF